MVAPWLSSLPWDCIYFLLYFAINGLVCLRFLILSPVTICRRNCFYTCQLSIPPELQGFVVYQVFCNRSEACCCNIQASCQVQKNIKKYSQYVSSWETRTWHVLMSMLCLKSVRSARRPSGYGRIVWYLQAWGSRDCQRVYWRAPDDTGWLCFGGDASQYRESRTVRLDQIRLHCQAVRVDGSLGWVLWVVVQG